MYALLYIFKVVQWVRLEPLQGQLQTPCLTFDNPTQKLVFFNDCSVESILTCIYVWLAICTVAESNVLKKIIGCLLPSLEALCCSSCLKKAF